MVTVGVAALVFVISNVAEAIVPFGAGPVSSVATVAPGATWVVLPWASPISVPDALNSEARTRMVCGEVAVDMTLSWITSEPLRSTL